MRPAPRKRWLVAAIRWSLLLDMLVMASAGCADALRVERPIDVHVGGRRMHLMLVGEARPGRPSVVLESGMGGGVGWNHTRGRIARFAQVVTYDRAGTGKSDPAAAEPRDARTVADDLRAALRLAGVEPPYVLVGQSLGGLYVQLFAARYPDETAGLVLVDPTHASENLALPVDDVKAWFIAHQPADWPRVEAELAKMPQGLRPFLACKYKLMETYIETVADERRRAEMRREWWAMVEKIVGPRGPVQLAVGEREEADALAESIRQAIAAKPPPRVPVILLAAVKTDLDVLPPEALTPNVRALQAEARRWRMAEFQKWADERPGSVIIPVEGSGHDIESEKPEAVIDAVRVVVR